MSSRLGGSDAGAENEDVEADEATRTEDARPIELDDDAQNVWNRDDDEGEPEDIEEGDRSVSLDAELEGEEFEDQTVPQDAAGVEEAQDEDIPQLAFERAATPDESPLDLPPASVTPTPRSPLASPGDSGSIPDDTPSLAESRLSSPARGASPTPRKLPHRTASGALQPFERRFESKLSASPSPSPRAGSPAFLSPHSRQISISSQFSQVSSQDGGASDEVPQAPWEVIRWTKLRKITGQAFSEVGKRNFGRPTCMAVSALIAVGTSKGLILGFDYHQTLKIIIGQGTKAAECGSVTALAISADYSTIASGHANGYIFTWEISRPARPFLHLPPVERSTLSKARHADGHASECAILHIGFLGTRHTALVSADSGGMAFSHLATRGLGAVTRTVHTTRLLGRYPSADPELERSRKPSSVLAFSPLPLGNVEQETDGMGLTALLTPYLLVIVSTTPIAQTQHKSARPKELSPHGTLSGCLAWFPAVKLKSTSKDSDKEVSDTKLVYCWSNVLTVLDVKVLPRDENADAQKPPKLEFHARSRWRADEAIVAVQWLGRSVLGVLTISQRLLILEDGSLQVTDSIDLLHRHIYHQDLFSRQLHTVVERLNSHDPSMHGVVADAFYMSFRAYKGRTFLLGFNDLAVGSLSNWADRLVALMETGDHIAAIRLATEYYGGVANNVTVGLPDNADTRHEMVRERLLGMLSASMDYTFSQRDDARDERLRELAEVCFDACITTQDTDYLFGNVFETFQDAEEEAVFVSTLEPYVLDGDIQLLPPEIVKNVVSHFISQNDAARLEELLCRLEPTAFDLDEISMLCRQHNLFEALIHVWTRAIGDFVSPLVDMLQLIKILEAGDDNDPMDNPLSEASMKVFPYLAYSLTGRRYPSGEQMEHDAAAHAKADLYEYVFSGRATAWPPGSKRVFHIDDDTKNEPAFPYLVLLLRFDAASFMSMLNEAFEDTFLNEADESSLVTANGTLNGSSGKSGFKMTRQHIISILLDVMQHNDFEPDETIYLDMFIARSLPKYSTQLVLSGSLLNNVLRRLCEVSSDDLRDDCQLSAEYLLSSYQPTDAQALIKSLQDAHFYRVLKTVYRRQRLYTELLETYFVDTDDREGVFACIASCLQQSSGISAKQLQTFKQTVVAHAGELADISTVQLATTLAVYAPDLLEQTGKALPDSYQQFLFLRALLEPKLLRENISVRSQQAVPEDVRPSFQERYVQLMCAHEPGHVADYVSLLQSGDLRLDRVLPAMESSGVIDAAVVLLARDGLTRDAMDRLVSHMQSQEHALTSLVAAATESPDADATRETADDLVEAVQKYTKVGVWLCQGQSAIVERRPRPRTNLAWDIDENDLDLDEFLWLNLVDVVVQVAKNVTAALKDLNDHPSDVSPDFSHIQDSLRGNVQQTFTALLAATSAQQAHQDQRESPKGRHQSSMSFLRVLRAFLTRAAATAPSLSDLRLVLADIFNAYAFEQNVLTLASDLLGSDVFTDINAAHQRRQRGWRPRAQVCELCKRRAWGTGIGEVVWDEWVKREEAREQAKKDKFELFADGDTARRRSRGKAKATGESRLVEERLEEVMGEDSKRMALVVFACRHVFHKACLDGGQMEEDGRRNVYRCRICVDQSQ